MLNFLVGPRWNFGSSTRWIPYVQVQAGGMKITHEEMYPDKKAELQALWESQGKTLGETEHHLYTRQAERSGYAMSVGAGVDRRLNNALSWRVASVDFTRGWVGSVDGYNYTNGLQITSGLVLKMGTWYATTCRAGRPSARCHPTGSESAGSRSPRADCCRDWRSAP